VRVEFISGLFNQTNHQPNLPVYDCVPSGEIWQFSKLKDSVIFMDEQRYYLDNLSMILAVVQCIVAQELLSCSPLSLHFGSWLFTAAVRGAYPTLE